MTRKRRRTLSRRQFIKGGVAAGLATTFPGLLLGNCVGCNFTQAMLENQNFDGLDLSSSMFRRRSHRRQPGHHVPAGRRLQRRGTGGGRQFVQRCGRHFGGVVDLHRAERHAVRLHLRADRARGLRVAGGRHLPERQQRSLHRREAHAGDERPLPAATDMHTDAAQLQQLPVGNPDTHATAAGRGEPGALARLRTTAILPGETVGKTDRILTLERTFSG